MRYTLRLLTIQQFQRALTLVCASELLRQEDVGKWGEERFTIGLWVGQSVTPNSYEDSKDALDQLKKERRVYGRSPYQVLYCPWCGSDIAPSNYVTDDELERTLIKCLDGDCPFGAASSELGVPALVVDQEIYRHPSVAGLGHSRQIRADGLERSHTSAVRPSGPPLPAPRLSSERESPIRLGTVKASDRRPP